MENNKDSIVICPGAQVIGDVELGSDVSIWHGAVLRGDTDSITIGNEVQCSGQLCYSLY